MEIKCGKIHCKSLIYFPKSQKNEISAAPGVNLEGGMGLLDFRGVDAECWVENSFINLTKQITSMTFLGKSFLKTLSLSYEINSQSLREPL